MGTKKEKRPPFTLEQRRQLAILHDDIDAFMSEFYAQHENNILYSIEPLSEARTAQGKKIRSVYGFDDPLFLEELQNKMEHYINRMFYITLNEPVRSVQNKLLMIYPRGDYLALSSQRTQTNTIYSHSDIDKRILKLQKAYNNEEVPQEEKESIEDQIRAYEEVLEYMTYANKGTIQSSTTSDRITATIYDDSDRVLAKEIFFHGGIMIKKDAEVRPPVKRKRRSDKIPEIQKLYVSDNKYFIMN